jgi:hypothetical protein
MTAASTVLECPINDGHKLRVEFFKSGDRYAHRLSAVVADDGGRETVVPLAESVEGDNDDPWPPSPPLQSLSIEELADGRTAALLVGMAGRSHWSASVEVAPGLGSPKFQLACRFTTVPDRLGSTYRIAPDVLMRRGKGMIGLANVDVGFLAHLSFHGVQPIVDDAGGSFEFQVPVNKLVPPATAQWCYELGGMRFAPLDLRKRITA